MRRQFRVMLDLALLWIDKRNGGPTKRWLGPTNGICICLGNRPKGAIMAIAIIFLFGIANFALHRAVLNSGHVMVKSLVSGRMARLGAGTVTLGLEFAVLLVAMLAANADPLWAWAYAGYSAVNGLAAWAILAGRI